MKKIKDKKIIILAIVLLVYTIGYFVIINKVSYAFDNNIDVNKLYNVRVDVITSCAISYGEDNKDSFNEEGLLYITVQTLVDNNYLVADTDGKITNYLDETETLNDKKIRLKNIDGKISAEIYS